MNHDNTVEEARKKECPFYAMSLIISMYKGGWHPEDEAVLFCKADNCMMWRWSVSSYPPTGYCGLVGHTG